MTQLSDRLNRLAPSATLAMSQKSSEMRAQGVDVINMSVGEPDFNTPEFIKEAGKKALQLFPGVLFFQSSSRFKNLPL